MQFDPSFGGKFGRKDKEIGNILWMELIVEFDIDYLWWKRKHFVCNITRLKIWLKLVCPQRLIAILQTIIAKAC